MQDQASGGTPGRFSALQYRRRRQCPLQLPRINDDPPTVSRPLAALVSGVALISAQPGDIAGRIRAEGQQRSRALEPCSGR